MPLSIGYTEASTLSLIRPGGGQCHLGFEDDCGRSGVPFCYRNMLNSYNKYVANLTMSSGVVPCYWKMRRLCVFYICYHIIAIFDRKSSSSLFLLLTRDVQTSRQDVVFFQAHSRSNLISFHTFHAKGHANKI